MNDKSDEKDVTLQPFQRRRVVIALIRGMLERADDIGPEESWNLRTHLAYLESRENKA
jgi:hypothetical protein